MFDRVIVVVGANKSGKSRLARMARQRGFTTIELDRQVYDASEASELIRNSPKPLLITQTLAKGSGTKPCGSVFFEFMADEVWLIDMQRTHFDAGTIRLRNIKSRRCLTHPPILIVKEPIGV